MFYQKFLTVLTAFIFIVFSSNALAVRKPLDHIVVVVNDDVITDTMLKNRVDDFKKQLELSQLSRIDPESLKKQVLERMISDAIQTQQAKQLGISVDDLMLNRMLEQLAKTNNMSLEVFRDTIEGEGINYNRFREQTRNEVLIQQLQQRIIASKINISDQDIKQHIQQNETLDSSKVSYHLRHILIATPESATPDDIDTAKQKAENVYQQVLGGEAFDDLAIKVSAGRNALKGGDLGNRKANELPQLFISAVDQLSPDEVSPPVRSASGFHLLQLVSSSNDQVMIQQTHARHILLRTSSEVSDEQARNTLLELRGKIQNGGKFSVIASEYSEDPGSKIKGGDLGWTSPGELVPIFENVASSLEIGQISEPFKSTYGWHILEVLALRQHDQTLSNKENQARNAIQKRKTDEELRLWLRRIRDEAFVEFIQ